MKLLTHTKWACMQLKKFPNIKDQIKLNSNFVEVLEPQITTLGLMGKSEDEDILYFISCGANGIFKCNVFR